MATKKHSSSSRNPAVGGDPLSADRKRIEAAELEVVGWHLSEIALACDALKRLGIELIDDGGDSLQGESVKIFAAKAGWLADECTRIIGGFPGPIVGAWEDWALSPAAKGALVKLNSRAAKVSG